MTPSPHHPMGAKGVGESPNVGSPAAFVNAVIDALSPLGVRHIDMPLTRDKVWRAIRDAEARKARSTMNLQYSGEEQIPAGLDTVWAFVTDPEKVGHCLPDVVDVDGAGRDALRGRREGRRRAGARQVQVEGRAPARRRRSGAST